MAIKFSIIIPAYNLEDYLSDCLQSIQAQTFDDIEVLIVDDGSTDGTGRVAQDFADRDSRFKVLRKENGGVSSARNLGLDRAVGEFVWFIDGDDYIHPESLAWLNHLFEESPAADYVTFGYEWTKKRHDGHFPSLESLCESQPLHFDCLENEDFEDVLRHSPIAVCCVCYRRGLIGCMRFMDIRSCEDRLFALEMCFSARFVVQTRAKIYSYYQRRSSASNSITHSFLADRFKFVDALLELRGRKERMSDSYLHFMFTTETFPGIMRDLVKLPNKTDRLVLFQRLLATMRKVQMSFPRDPAYAHIDKIIEKESYHTAWLYLVLRYMPRRFIGKNPFFLNCYRWLFSRV